MTVHSDSPHRWFIMYGKQLLAAQLNGVTLAIVEPDAISPQNYAPTTRFFAYVSIGEADSTRSFWKQIRDSTVVIEKNPDWPESYRVDIRSPLWQKILTDHIIPDIVQKKFSGIFLDTIDTPLYLEDRDPKKFSRSTVALVQLIKSLKKKFPQLGILPNNGLPILDQIGTIIDGVVVEDLVTHYNFSTKSVETPPADETAQKEAQLDHFIQKFKKPVYVVLYGDPQSALVQQAIARCRTKGYHWYVSTVDLMTIGTME